MSEPIGTPGPAASAVLDGYHRRVAQYRHRVLRTRVVTAILVVWALAGALVAPVLAVSTGTSPAWLGMGLPLGVLIIWWIARDRLADAFGTSGEPPFPAQALETAARQDAAALAPRVFGAAPESMRTNHPEHW